MKRAALALGLALFAVLWNAEAYAQDPVLTFAEDDRAMNTAIAQAQETPPQFLANAMGSEGASIPGALLKAGLSTVNGVNTIEHIWIMPFARLTGTEFAGILANEPQELGDLRIGDACSSRWTRSATGA